VTTPVSGNRWEPSAGPTPEETDPRASTRRRPRIPRPRLWLVAVAAAFFLVGGVGGFLVAEAVSGHGDGTGRIAPADHRGPRPGPDADDRGSDHDWLGRGVG
jgi:hypothetical protein